MARINDFNVGDRVEVFDTKRFNDETGTVTGFDKNRDWVRVKTDSGVVGFDGVGLTLDPTKLRLIAEPIIEEDWS